MMLSIIPVPNVVAGILIGLTNQNWIGVVVASCAWSAVFGLMSFLNPQSKISIAVFREKSKRNPILVFFIVEFATAISTALPIASIAFGIKSFF